MHTIVVGLNYKTAPVEIREKLSFIESELSTAMEQLQKQTAIRENVIVSTCNRTEIYAVVDQVNTSKDAIIEFLCNWFHLPVEQFKQHVFIYEDDASIAHLMKVSAGIDSMILGETQILGQVRKSFLQAQEIGATDAFFNKLFKQAITFAKRMHHDTAIGENAVSVSYAAVELAKQTFPTLKNKHVAILGAGKMAELAIENLYGSGVDRVTVLNRTYETAKQLAEKFNGEAKPFDALPQVLSEVDIILTSTGAPSYVINHEMMAQVKRTNDAPLMIIDIAVPRDVEPTIAQLPNVYLHDVDDLQHIVQKNLAVREHAAKQIELYIVSEIVEWNEWCNTLGAGPLLQALSEKVNHIHGDTMNSLLNKLPDLSEREKSIISKHTKSIINQLLKEPIAQAKELASSDNADAQLQLFQQIFGLHDLENNKR